MRTGFSERPNATGVQDTAAIEYANHLPSQETVKAGNSARIPPYPRQGSEDIAVPSRGDEVDSQISSSQASRFKIENLELESPIATLRSLGALEGNRNDSFSPFDPICRGKLTIQEAEDAVHM
jgi:hypothetical protein